MTVDWFFMQKGRLFRPTKSVGPISEPDLLQRIDRGEIKPETLLRSVSKTRDRWIPMSRVAPAMRRYLENTHGRMVDE